MSLNSEPKGPVSLKDQLKNQEPIKQVVNHLHIPDNTTLDKLTANTYSYADILDNIVEARKDLTYVTGKANKAEIHARLKSLETAEKLHDSHEQIAEAHEENYEAFMSFNEEQRNILRQGYVILQSLSRLDGAPISEGFLDKGVKVPSDLSNGKGYENIPALDSTSMVDVGMNDLQLMNDVQDLVKEYKSKRNVLDSNDSLSEGFNLKLADDFVKEFEATFYTK